MKNNFILIILSFFIFSISFAENINIKSKIISVDKKKEISIFKDEVEIIDIDGNKITTDYAEYNNIKKFIILKGNIQALDNKGNNLSAEQAVYDENKGELKTAGKTNIETNEGYKLVSEDVILNSKLNFIESKKTSKIVDVDNNQINLENFYFNSKDNIFRSTGLIKIFDNKKNSYEFSQIYIDTKKKEIIGTDVKAYLNQKDFKLDKRNKPRIFANTVEINSNQSTFDKSVFTICDYRKNDKCPPWSLRSSKMRHNKETKTIFYENAVIKVYDFPIFYFPVLSHPDPTVDRRSGFLPPSFSDTKNLGSGLSIPYYLALGKDKDFTFTNKLYVSENPLFLGEYRQAFQNSNLIIDSGYTEGYKKTSSTKKAGEKSHFFSQFVKSFVGNNESKNNLSIKIQDVSNDKYLKLYKIKTDIVDYNKDILENSLSFSHEKDDLFFGLEASIYETLKSDYNDKYEYFFPEITLDKNLFSSNKFGSLDFQSNFKAHNYDTNKTTNFLVNDFDWEIRNFNFNSGIRSKLFSNIKNINYESKNVERYKTDTTNEIFGAFGYLTELDLYKEVGNNISHQITPKILLKYAPDHMRKEASGSKLNPLNLFSLNRLNNINNFESGTSATIGFDYEMIAGDKKFDLLFGQVINYKENKNMPSETSLDEKLSDLVGTSSLKLNKNFNLDYNFAIDENYKELNYNEIGATVNLNLFKFNIDYLQEKEHIGNSEYIKTNISYSNNKNTKLKFETKRSLITNSSEFYDLSYEYLNDCLKAGIVYRREFYNDSELESENSLMFKITLIPFGKIDTPAINR